MAKLPSLAELTQMLTAARPAARWPTITDRGAWDRVRIRLGEQRVAARLRQAAEDAATPIPSLPATLFLDFERTGRRERYEEPFYARRDLLASLQLAECLDDRGRFLDPILDLAWAICEESSWALPAHQSTLTDILLPVVDLGVAMTALQLAEGDLLLGDRLDPLLRKRIRDELERRCFTPYLSRDDFWWLTSQEGRAANWTAVCTGGIVGAALCVEPEPMRLATLLQRAFVSMSSYIDSFDPDGGSSEGPGYWDYGFGYYTIWADLVHWRTGGALDPLAGDRIRAIASYPLRTVLSRGVNVNFSDSDSAVSYEPAHLHYLAQRLDIPELAALARQQLHHDLRSALTWPLRRLFWTPDTEEDGSFVPARHDWFSGMMWMIARYDPADDGALVLAAKGGHNAEMHNQNDVGAFIVHVEGESVIADVGRGRYTKAYFGAERYNHFANSSFGHSVPVPNGCLQVTDRRAAAVLLDHSATAEEDTLALDLTAAYPPEAGLAALTRRLTLHRSAPRGWVELVDQGRFAAGRGAFESVLTVFGNVELGDGGLVIHGERGALRVTYDDTAVTVHLDLHRGIDLAHGPRDVSRIVFAWSEPQNEGTIRLEIVPV